MGEIERIKKLSEEYFHLPIEQRQIIEKLIIKNHRLPSPEETLLAMAKIHEERKGYCKYRKQIGGKYEVG